MIVMRLVAVPIFLGALTLSATAASVSSSRQLCIRSAMTAGAAALGNPAQLDRLYERYFAGDKIAQLAAGKDWKRYDNAQKNAQRNRVRRTVVQVLAPSLSRYSGSRVKFVSESGTKVRGILTSRNGERRTVTWDFAGQCKFINVSIAGFGSLISYVGKESARN
ncbi:MAG TPA: ABC transporter substrate-binding protein [Aestuariivirgaceae bacterium]